MATTLSLIAKQTVGSGGASSVTFSNIPQTYTDLKVVLSGRVDYADTQSNCSVSINGSTSSFSGKLLYGYGSGVGSSSRSDNLNVFLVDGANATSSTFSNCELYFPNYTSSNYKSFSAETATENNGTTALLQMNAELWSNTAAITSITLTSQNGNFVEFSTFYLYGISNSSTQNTSVPYASGGDIIRTDGTYWYHAFKYSGSFTPLKNLTADVLVVAGGGGGGFRIGGGGGAGGTVAYSAQSLTTQNYNCTIGAGGAGGTGGAAVQGGNSQFGALTALVGGGAGGSGISDNGTTGGSGGGGGNGYSGKTGTSGQGNTGGNGGGANIGGGGGGGVSSAGSAGGNGANGGGNGGSASNTWSSWLSATSLGVSGYIAGGGGGGGYSAGAGGTSGGGGATNGVVYPTNADNATANTGSGGGAGGQLVSAPYTGTNGGNGGSGLIIVKYAV